MVHERKRKFSKEELILLVASSITMSRDTPALFAQTDADKVAIKKYISRMTDSKIFRKSSYEKKLLRLTTTAVNRLQTDNPDLYEFYMTYTSNNRPGRTPRHVDAQCKAAEVNCMMYRAGIKIASEKPSLIDIEEGRSQPYLEGDAFFYLRKELIFDVEQEKQRAQTARGCGVLLSPGLTGVVYRLTTSDTIFRFASELESIQRALEVLRHASQKKPDAPIKDALVIGNGYDSLIDLVHAKKKAHARTRGFGDLLEGRERLPVSIRYVPMGLAGVEPLRVITEFTEDEIVHRSFSSQEIALAEGLRCDAVVQMESSQLKCYEFISGNLTKIVRAKNSTPEGGEVGLVCLKQQQPFLQQLFEGVTTRFRTYDDCVLTADLFMKGGD